MKDPKVRNQLLVDEYGWSNDETKKIWCFGPNVTGPNVLVDQASGVQYLDKVRDHLLSSFDWVTKEGVLTEEPMRGARFNITDALIHADNPHRSAAQMVPCARRVFYASQLTASPRFMEPVFLVEIQCPDTVRGVVYTLIPARRGEVFEELPIEGTPLITMKAYLPVSESFGFQEILRKESKGYAFPQMVFDHWQDMPGDPLVEGNLASEVVKKIRARKGLKVNIPGLDTFHDKL